MKEWLKENFENIGHVSSVDLKQEYLVTAMFDNYKSRHTKNKNIVEKVVKEAAGDVTAKKIASS